MWMHIIFFSTEMFEKEVNNLLKNTEERQPSKKRTNSFGRSISNFFLTSKIPLKKGCHRIIFRGPWSINCQEQFTYQVCGNYVVQTFDSPSFSKIKLPF
jgi:hypothetical protein